MQAPSISDADLIEWLNHWLASFEWSSETRLCTLWFKDPYDKRYHVEGKDLRECVLSAVVKHPTSLTFMKGESR